MRQIGVVLRQERVAGVVVQLRVRAQRAELVVQRLSRTRGLSAGDADDVTRIAVADDVRRVRRDRLPRASAVLLFVGERVRAGRLDAARQELHGDDVRVAVQHHRGRWCVGECPEIRDAHRAAVPAVRVTADGVVATLASLPHVAEPVDDEVVADVSPASRHGVEVIDRTDLRGGVGVRVRGHGVMHDRFLPGNVFRPPLHQRFIRAPVLACADGHRIHRRARGPRRLHVVHGAAEVVQESRQRRGVEVRDVNEGERERLHVAHVDVGAADAVLRVAHVADAVRTGVVLVRGLIDEIVVLAHRLPLVPRRAIGADANLDRRGGILSERQAPMDADGIETLTGVDDVAGDGDRRARLRVA